MNIDAALLGFKQRLGAHPHMLVPRDVCVHTAQLKSLKTPKYVKLSQDFITDNAFITKNM